MSAHSWNVYFNIAGVVLKLMENERRRLQVFSPVLYFGYSIKKQVDQGERKA